MYFEMDVTKFKLPLHLQAAHPNKLCQWFFKTYVIQHYMTRREASPRECETYEITQYKFRNFDQLRLSVFKFRKKYGTS